MVFKCKAILQLVVIIWQVNKYSEVQNKEVDGVIIIQEAYILEMGVSIPFRNLSFLLYFIVLHTSLQSINWIRLTAKFPRTYVGLKANWAVQDAAWLLVTTCYR